MRAAPSFATSAPPPLLQLDIACKAPGASCEPYIMGYDFSFTVTNNTPDDVWFYKVVFTVMDSNGVDVSGEFTDTSAYPLMVAAGTATTVIFAAYTGNSANLKGYTFYLSIFWGHTSAEGADPNNHPPLQEVFTFASTPPNCCH
jgi:hypothetical protein